MIIIVMGILLFIGSNLCLQWSSSGDSNILQSPILLSLTTPNPAIDMYYRDQVIIYKDIATYSNVFTIYCLVSEYGPKSRLVYMFCKEDLCSDEWDETKLVIDLQIFNYKVSRATNPPGKKGLILKLQFPGSSLDASGNFHCEVQNKIGNFMIRSNDFQIRDTHFWSQYIILNNDNTKTIFLTNVTRDKMPITFKCAQNGLIYNPGKPVWYQQLSMSPVEWSICPVMGNYKALATKDKQTFSNCVQFTTQILSGNLNINPIRLSSMSSWTTYVDNIGDLHIYDILSDDHPPEVTFALMCYIKVNNLAVPINTYFQSNKGDEIVSGVYFRGTPSTYTIPLKPLVPLVQNVTLYLKKLIKPGIYNRIVSLVALYQASSTTMTYWKYNGKQLNSGTHIHLDKYSVKFVGDITTKMAGTYTLDVTDGPDKLAFTFVVTVLGPPTLVNPDCMPLIQYVMEFDSISFHCSYNNQPQLLSLQINSADVHSGQSSNLSMIIIKKLYPYLYDLNFTVQLEPDSITYQVFNLRKSQGQTKYQDHTIMFYAKNEFGLNLKTSSIYVVPRLIFPINSAPESYNCTVDCSSQASHRFQCQVRLGQYDNKELRVDHHWTVNGHRLELNATHQFAPYFSVNPDTKELILNPVISNDTKRDKFVKEALKNNFIECHVDLVSLAGEFKYFSTDDRTLKSSMKARITLDYKGKSLAYIYWIIMSVLVLVIILIFLILLVRVCVRNRLITYQLDKLERQRGFDPENEVRLEAFKPYQRKVQNTEEHTGTSEIIKLSVFSSIYDDFDSEDMLSCSGSQPRYSCPSNLSYSSHSVCL